MQRAGSLLAAVAVVAGLGACTPGAPPSDAAGAASTAVAGAQNAVGGAQGAVSSAQQAVGTAQRAVSSVQTALPAGQATAQAAATAAARFVASPPLPDVARALGGVLSGVSVDVSLTPDAVPNDQVSRAIVTGADSRGGFANLDADGQQRAATAALLVAGQIYPQATVELRIVDASGRTLLSGTKAPGAAPVLHR